ncbi:barnase inhibitor [Comamonadaceae bacterium OH3737_COT-264]|nr:barnase inhibitor [Comamonadaceae bacterium OH3737_COT-264]
MSAFENHARQDDAPLPAEVAQWAAQLEKAVPANLVQSIRAYRPAHLQAIAQHWGQHFLHAALDEATTKPRILEEISRQFLLASPFGRSLQALLQSLTTHLHQSGPQPGFIVVLEHIPISVKFDKEMREKLLDVFRDTADFWADRQTPFRCFYSFY